MYLDFYQLREYPFSLACDPRFLYFSPAHKEAMAGMLYCLRERKGVALLLGEPGTGKTTLLAAVSASLPGGVIGRSLDTPLHATPAEALAAILRAFQLQPEDGGMSAMLTCLHGFLLDRAHHGECVLLLVDEAQDLNPQVLEQVRLLTNLEAGGHKLLQIILSGQPELDVHLRTASGRALHQRIAVRCHLTALNARETAAYVGARLELAGAARALFDALALERIYLASHGIPRVINVLADHCLLAGFAAQAPLINAATVERVSRQLGMNPQSVGTAAAAARSLEPPVAPVTSSPATRPAPIQRFAASWARWAGLSEGGN